MVLVDQVVDGFTLASSYRVFYYVLIHLFSSEHEVAPSLREVRLSRQETGLGPVIDRLRPKPVETGPKTVKDRPRPTKTGQHRSGPVFVSFSIF